MRRQADAERDLPERGAENGGLPARH